MREIDIDIRWVNSPVGGMRAKMSFQGSVRKCMM